VIIELIFGDLDGLGEIIVRQLGVDDGVVVLGQAPIATDFHAAIVFDDMAVLVLFRRQMRSEPIRLP
jgi:hypothetical protein